jgi:hypothetical protein
MNLTRAKFGLVAAALPGTLATRLAQARNAAAGGCTMTSSPRPDEVRKIVLGTLRQFGAVVPRLNDLKETIFLSEGRCLARSYRASGLLAMWLIDDSIVQVYDAEGNMLQTINLSDQSSGQHRAAA